MIQYLPVIALRGTTILPDMIVHFDVSRKKSVKALEKAMVEDQRVFLITQKAPQTEDPGQEDLYKIGPVAVIKQLVKTKSGIIQVLVEGRERGELLHLDEEGLYLEAEIAVFDPSLNQSLDENIKEAMLRGIKEIFIRYCNENPKLSKDLAGQYLEIKDVDKGSDQIAVNLAVKYEDKQKILEAEP